MPRFSWRGLTSQMLAILILPLTIVMLAVAFGGLRLHHLSMRTLVGERDARAARAAANALEEQLRHRQVAIQSLAMRLTPDASPQELADLLGQSAFLLSDFDGGVAFFTPAGDLIAFRGDAPLWENLDDFRPPIGGTTPTGTPFPAHLIAISHPAHSQPMMLVLTPASDNRPLVVGAFSLEGLLHSVVADIFDPTRGGLVYVVDSSHRLLYHLGDMVGARSLTDQAAVNAALSGQSGSTYLQVNRREHVVAYTPVRPVGWALVIEEPWETVTSPLLRTTAYAPLVLIPMLLLALLALWFGTHRIVQPLQALETKASALAWGDFDAIQQPVGGVSEIRHLQTALTHMAQKVRIAQQGLRGYIAAMTRGQEEERRRLARELHDDTLQALIALNQRVQLARYAANGSQYAETLGEIQQLTEHTIQDLRRLTRALRPIYLEDLGLTAALEMLARETRQTSALEVVFHRRGSEVRLSPELELALYRIAQEALSNVVRHANAAAASLEIAFSPDEVSLAVADHGRGFAVPDNPAEFAPGGHFGLLGMYERAELIGARLEIQSTPGEGTRVIVLLPQAP